MGKKLVVNKEMFGWLKNIQDEGYQYIIMPRKNKSEFYATKANQKKDGTFRDTAKFDVFKLENSDEWIGGKDTKGVFLHLDKKISCKSVYWV